MYLEQAGFLRGEPTGDNSIGPLITEPTASYTSGNIVFSETEPTTYWFELDPDGSLKTLWLITP